jgi:DNA-directed RNA polymerase subunit M/transcription elongation factor TFIIS
MIRNYTTIRYATQIEKLIDKNYNNSNYVLYEVIQELSNNVSPQEIINKLKNNKILWNNPIYDNIKNQIEEVNEFIINPFVIEEGAIQCFKCKSKRVFSFAKQTRSADEPTSVFSECAECKHKWKYSG